MNAAYTMRTLVVDDYAPCRVIHRKALEYAGHEVDCAMDGLEAVEMYMQAIEAGRPYEFVCLDNNMPIMDGYEAMEFIRGYERVKMAGRLPATICFVSGDHDLKSRYLKEYCPDINTRFLEKPLNITLLRTLVKVISYERACWEKYASA